MFVISFEIGVSVLTPMVGRMLNIEFYFIVLTFIYTISEFDYYIYSEFKKK